MQGTQSPAKMFQIRLHRKYASVIQAAQNHYHSLICILGFILSAWEARAEIAKHKREGEFSSGGVS